MEIRGSSNTSGHIRSRTRQRRTSPSKVLSNSDSAQRLASPSARMTHEASCSAHTRVPLHTEAPAHHRGLGPQCHYFTFDSRQDTRKDPSAPLNKLVTHLAALSRGPNQASRSEITQIGTYFFHTHAEALPILAVVPRTLSLLRASLSLSSTMAQQEHPLLRWRHLIDPPIHLIDPHLYVIEAHFYLIEPLIDSIEIHR